MTSTLHTWALRWHVSPAALQDLQIRLGLLTPLPPENSFTNETARSEGYVQSAVRLEASQKGMRLFRNNVGVLPDRNGRPVRFGLANDSPAMNDALKSGDLIGIRRVVITQEHVGYAIGQFVSRECKTEGWQYTGTEREIAQRAWMNLVVSLGGDAAFATKVGTL